MDVKIITNKIQCKHCGDIIESTRVHDYKKCKCGKVSVDGGKEYMSRNFPGFPWENHFKELSHYIDEDGNEVNNDE